MVTKHPDCGKGGHWVYTLGGASACLYCGPPNCNLCGFERTRENVFEQHVCFLILKEKAQKLLAAVKLANELLDDPAVVAMLQLQNFSSGVDGSNKYLTIVQAFDIKIPK